MKSKEKKEDDPATLHSRINQLYTVCQSLTVDSIAKDEDIAQMSRECGELRLKLERSDTELQKSQTTSRQEVARSRLILAEMIKLMDSVPETISSSPVRVFPNESLSSELSRFQSRLKLLVSLSENAAQVVAKDDRISELEETLKLKEKEYLQSTNEFNIKLLDMKQKMDILNGELDVLQSNPSPLRLPLATKY